MSDVQRRQMTSAHEPNVHNIAVEGTFDDCQGIVKALFNDAGLRDRLSLTGINSINFARILAQIVYYFTSAVALGSPHRAVSFAVPTGNFGDIFAGYAARAMGLPVKRLVIATNLNDSLARALSTGIYEPRGVIATSSPSMDIQLASNFERLLFELAGRDAARVRARMDELRRTGAFHLEAGELAELRALFAAHSIDEHETEMTIRNLYAETGVVIDPHTAVGLAAARQENFGTPDDRAVDGAPGQIPGSRRARHRPHAEQPERLKAKLGQDRAPDRAAQRRQGRRRLHRRSRAGRAPRSARECRAVQTDEWPHRGEPCAGPTSRPSSLGIWVGAGSRSESLPEHGVAHFLEHMAFKGTARRSAQDIAEEIEAVGGELNAATGVELDGLLRARAAPGSRRSRSIS